MNIELSSDQQAEISSLVRAGRFASAEAAVAESVHLLLLREKVNVGIDQADKGDVIDHDTLFNELRANAEGIQRDMNRQ